MNPSGRYVARIWIPETQSQMHLGIFDTPEEASAVFEEEYAKKKKAGHMERDRLLELKAERRRFRNSQIQVMRGTCRHDGIRVTCNHDW